MQLGLGLFSSNPEDCVRRAPTNRALTREATGLVEEHPVMKLDLNYSDGAIIRPCLDISPVKEKRAFVFH
jgi:hypothetical protein